MVVDSARQIRVIVLPESAPSNAEISEIVKKSWQVGRLTPGSRLVLLTAASGYTVGTTEHARQSHEAALALYRSNRFRRVEADVPVPVDVDLAAESLEAAGDNLCVDNPPPLDWVHQILNWPEAMAAMSDTSRGGVGISIGQPDSGYTLHPNLGAAGLDLNRDRDVIDGDDDALDDLVPNPLWPFPTPDTARRPPASSSGRERPRKGSSASLAVLFWCRFAQPRVCCRHSTPMWRRPSHMPGKWAATS